MNHYLIMYAIIATVVGVLDFLWLGVLAKNFYKESIGHLMAERPNMIAAGLFYLIYPIGLLIFAALPGQDSGSWTGPAALGAAFAFFAYFTFDLSNLAILRNFPTRLAVVDVVWGAFVGSAAVSLAVALPNLWVR
jgi:uncharacterized membrane protein